MESLSSSLPEKYLDSKVAFEILELGLQRFNGFPELCRFILLGVKFHLSDLQIERSDCTL